MNYNEKRPIIENKRIIFSIIILFYILKYLLRENYFNKTKKI